MKKRGIWSHRKTNTTSVWTFTCPNGEEIVVQRHRPYMNAAPVMALHGSTYYPPGPACTYWSISRGGKRIDSRLTLNKARAYVVRKFGGAEKTTLLEVPA